MPRVLCQTCLQVFTGGMSAGLADTCWSEACDRAEQKLELLAASNNFATSLAAQGKYAEKRVLGPEHCGTLVTAGNLALPL